MLQLFPDGASARVLCLCLVTAMIERGEEGRERGRKRSGRERERECLLLVYRCWLCASTHVRCVWGSIGRRLPRFSSAMQVHRGGTCFESWPLIASYMFLVACQTVHLTPPLVMMQRDSLGQFTPGSAGGDAGGGNDTDGSVSSSGGKSTRAERAMAAVEEAAAAASAALEARRGAVD